MNLAATYLCTVSVLVLATPFGFGADVVDFLTHYPQIAEMKFGYHREGFPTKYCFARCQTNGVLLRTYSSMEGLEQEGLPPVYAGARFERQHWFFHEGDLTTWLDTGRPDEGSNTVVEAFALEELKLNKALNLGLSWLPRPALQISNNTFHFHHPDGDFSRGELEFAKGRLTAARWHNPPKEDRKYGVDMRLDYNYGKSFREFPFLPSEWILYGMRIGVDRDWVKLEELTIYSISAGQSKADLFSPEASHLGKLAFHGWVSGTNVMYYEPSAGTNVAMRSLSDPAAVKHAKTGSKTRAVYFLLAILLVVPLFLAISRHPRPN